MTDLSKILYSVKDMCEFKEKSDIYGYSIIIKNDCGCLAAVHLIDKKIYDAFHKITSTYGKILVPDCLSLKMIIIKYNKYKLLSFINILNSIHITINKYKYNEIFKYNIDIIIKKCDIISKHPNSFTIMLGTIHHLMTKKLYFKLISSSQCYKCCHL